MKNSTLYSIGHGNKSLDNLIEELEFFDINYLIDVRSKPYSKFYPQFNKNNIKNFLEKANITYVFMGNSLGGLPDDKTCYTNGHVDYDKLKEKDYFQKGLKRLINAHNKQIKLVIMCSESNPAHCHRSKLIGEELRKHGILLNHIVRNPKTGYIFTKNQITVMQEVAPQGLMNLFGENIRLTSRKKYKKENQ